ncbi:ABC-2 type transporter [Coniella lustricola]|uniref:ABC-2 type transporter n=1 Tax=Coniella lustricola TaxID=2025994 RepID=A0A2T3A5Q2_9PEZI|nr:ABC-2 type transporter [Coniella lustricola]
MMNEADTQEMRRIATALSRRESTATHAAGATAQVFKYDTTDSTLQPDSPSFDASKWLRHYLAQLEIEGIKPMRLDVLFKDVTVAGTGSALQLQETVGSALSTPLRPVELLNSRSKTPRKILHSFDGLLRSGELLIVLGRPGSGCSTFLKTLCGELQGLNVDDTSDISFSGIPSKQMAKEFKGELIYNQEVDKHFPHLTVGQTLEFAAAVRTRREAISGMSHTEYCKLQARVAMAICGLSHTYNTKVGDDFVRGVSGGERKRVSIAEMILAGSPFTAWDNSTRGLDAATALRFVESLRLASDVAGATNAVAIYQASQAIYDLFDKAVGWYCPQRQTTGDFLTSVTNPGERKARKGMEHRVPVTPDDFAKYWHESPEYATLQREMQAYIQGAPELSEDESSQQGGPKKDQALSEFREHRRQRQSKHARPGSAYTVTIPQQIALNTKRAYQRIWGDKASTVVNAGMQLVLSLIIGSIFYDPVNMNATAGMAAKGSALYIAILSNGLTAISEINNLYAQRPIVEKHASYAFYHPATEALAGIVADIPVKFITAAVFNIVLYFMACLRREAGAFFLFFLITYMSTFVMGGIFRTLGAITKTSSQAMSLAGVMILALTLYTGFMVAVPQMVDWFGWLRWLNPLYYAFEILIGNEFHGREFICSSILPPYTPLQGDSWICDAVGAVAGRSTVNGDSYINTNYSYYWSHAWRNLGILFAFLIFFTLFYAVCTELSSGAGSTAEFLVFQRGHVPAHLQDANSPNDEEKQISSSSQGPVTGSSANNDASVGALVPQKDIFTWKDVVYDIQIKGEPRRLLDHVSGWVKPGTLTALMGVSGAGKTTLLDVLAQRTTMGVITGDMLVSGKPLDESFQRKTGYVQQQDLHLGTATVRESLRFSAMLRQPKTVSKQEKYQFVEEVIQMLDMSDFADAVVGSPGEGLNVEQRKLLTIGVELAAKPKLLLFLDEPTSGLDSQSSWAIVSFLRKLADAGQAVLCTIHQPSAILFQEFDRLLFLAKGGKTVYFGEIGKNSRTLLDYFESRGARKCEDSENPAEYMLEIGNAKDRDWFQDWQESTERKGVEHEISRIQNERQDQDLGEGSSNHDEFAMPFSQQLKSVTVRVFQQYWRMPSYLFSKLALGIVAGLFIGFSFYGGGNSIAGMRNIIFAVFGVTTLFSSVVQQVHPLFVTQRSLYEVRERPSKAYSWKAFVIANIVVELPYQILAGIATWACFYYPVVGTSQSGERQVLVLLFCCMLYIYASTFAHMTVAAVPDATTAGAVVTLLFLLSIMFCGVLQTPVALPGFWIFMYRLSPFTYWISGMVSTMIHDRAVTCSSAETSTMNPPAGETCGAYFAAFLESPAAVGTLQNPNDTSACRYCSISSADTYLAGSNIYYSERWRNFGIMWAYVVFNIFVAVATYYLFRVRPAKRAAKGGKK